ncbi:MAG: DUF535 family protein [Bacteroidota bacterium]
MKGIQKNVSHLANIIINYTPVLFLNFRKHFELYRVLKFYSANGLIKFRTYRIYLFTYISKKLSIKEKLFILTHHYSFLKQSFRKKYLKKIFSGGVICWEEYNGVDSFKILLRARHYLEFEGSLTLSFMVNDTRVFNLNFNFAPGDIFGFEKENTILFISGLKGVENEFSKITLVSKAFFDLSPRIILMKVLENVGATLGVDTIVAVNVSNQVSYNNKEVAGRFYVNYDQFWEKLNGRKMKEGYYSFKCPIPEKPIHLVRHKYKKRALNRRSRLNEIAAKTVSILSGYTNELSTSERIQLRSLKMAEGNKILPAG